MRYACCGAGCGLCPQTDAADQGVTGSPRTVPQPGHRSQRRSHRTPSVTRGSYRYCRAQRALLRLNLPTARSQPTGPSARAPADWLTRRASSRATSAPGRGRAQDHAPPRLRPAPGAGTRTPARSQDLPKAADPGPQRRGNPTGAKRGRAVPGRPRGWTPRTIFGVFGGRPLKIKCQTAWRDSAQAADSCELGGCRPV